MIANPRKFYLGTGLMASFAMVFVLIFTPIFNGKNGLEYLDDLYNSISKGSAYYLPQLSEEIAPLKGTAVTLALTMESEVQAEQTQALFEKSGATVSRSANGLTVSGDLGAMLAECIKDADLMYNNQGTALREKYGMNERQVLYNWWTATKLMDKDLKKQKRFQEAKLVVTVEKKGVETSYNYYTIEPQKISDKWGIVMFSLIFYVVYTLWYGYGIMYLFEGWGLQLDH